MTVAPTRAQLAALLASFAAGAALARCYTLRHLPRRDPAERAVAPTALLAAVELGGTTVRAAVAYADSPTSVFDSVEVATASPEDTMRAVCAFLDRHAPFVALGVASFGPLDLDRGSASYGFITTTPKVRWRGFNLLGCFKGYGVPVGFDTDVNAPALAELRYGSHHRVDSCAYITVGTGIGVGLVVNGRPVHGLVHPEGGHILPLQKVGDSYPGWSAVHRKSVESMASARACAERAGVEPSKLVGVSDQHPMWDDIAYYLAQLCLTITYVASPHVIVLSGGVMKRTILFPKIRAYFLSLNEGYIAAPRVVNEIDRYIVPSTYGNNIGIIGAIELARRAAAGL